MDWYRFLRAVEAENTQAIEQQRAAQIAGHVEKLDAATWEAIRAHDELLDEFDVG